MTKLLKNARTVLLLPLMSLLAACGGSDEAAAPGADTVYNNGRIYTVDPQRSWAEAIAVSDGKIVYVGSNDGAAAHIGGNTRVVDLKGHFVLPGLQDSHVHPIGGGIEASACNLNGQPGLAEYRTVIGEYAAANPDVPWILGGGWAMSVFGPGGSPNRDILDELVPDRPVFLCFSRQNL